MPILCKRCGATIGDSARRCPQCGGKTPLTADQELSRISTQVFVLLVLLVLTGVILFFTMGVL